MTSTKPMNLSKSLILASTSPFRKRLLERLGLPFNVLKPSFNEDLHRDTLPPKDLAIFFAEQKALHIDTNQFPAMAAGALVIGGDQILCCENKVYGKPAKSEKAMDQLRALSGKTHELLTAVCLMNQGKVFAQHLQTTRLKMRKLSEEEIRWIVTTDAPLESAGSYKIEAHGVSLFESIECDDWTGIEGLPLLWVHRKIRDFFEEK